VIGDDSVVGLGGIEVLHQVIPNVPLPDDLAALRPGRAHLDDALGPEHVLAEERRIPAGGDRVVERLGRPGDEEYVAVRHRLDVVVVDVGVGAVVEPPLEVAVPVGSLDSSAHAASDVERRHHRPAGGTQQVSVLEKVDHGVGKAGPGVHERSVRVDQIRTRMAERRVERVARGDAGLLHQQPLGLGERGRGHAGGEQDHDESPHHSLCMTTHARLSFKGAAK